MINSGFMVITWLWLLRCCLTKYKEVKTYWEDIVIVFSFYNYKLHLVQIYSLVSAWFFVAPTYHRWYYCPHPFSSEYCTYHVRLFGFFILHTSPKYSSFASFVSTRTVSRVAVGTGVAADIAVFLLWSDDSSGLLSQISRTTLILRMVSATLWSSWSCEHWSLHAVQRKGHLLVTNTWS